MHVYSIYEKHLHIRCYDIILQQLSNQNIVGFKLHVFANKENICASISIKHTLA